MARLRGWTCPSGISCDSEPRWAVRGNAPLAAFEALLSKCIAEALVAQLRKEAEAHGVDVVTWLMRDQSTDE